MFGGRGDGVGEDEGGEVIVAAMTSWEDEAAMVRFGDRGLKFELSGASSEAWTLRLNYDNTLH